jgi:diguanylate cyclase (GGDEF)-like protein
LFSQHSGGSSLDELRSAFQNRHPTQATFQVRRKRGAAVWSEIQVSPIRDEAGIATHYIVVFRDLTEERRSRQELEYYAHHDLLTGLPNRRFLETRLERALSKAESSGGSFSIILLDLNSFKLVNDCFGHDAGDELLKCVGQRLKQCVREEDTVARLGGDEFVLLLEGDERASPETIISRVTQSLRHPVSLNGRLVAASCSSGIGRYPLDGRDASALLKAADRNLYRAKAASETRRRPASFATCGN